MTEDDVRTEIMCAVDKYAILERFDRMKYVALILTEVRARYLEFEEKVKADALVDCVRAMLQPLDEIHEILAHERAYVKECNEIIRDVVSDSLANYVRTSEEHSLSDPTVRQYVWDLTGGLCSYCGITLVMSGGGGDQFCIEHVVPASKGGPNNIVNYVPSCRGCNNSKGDGHVLKFIKNNLPRRIGSADNDAA